MYLLCRNWLTLALSSSNVDIEPDSLSTHGLLLRHIMFHFETDGVLTLIKFHS